MQIVIKTKKMFDGTLMLGSLSLALTQDTTLGQIFFSNLYLLDSIFSTVVWTKRFHDFDIGICFPDTAAMILGKRHFYSDHSNGC